MTATSSTSTSGTPEECWAAWAPLAEAPRLAVPRGQVVLISAHPDDEVLGAGGLLATLGEDTPEPRFVLATDGEASHAHAPDVDPEALAGARIEELADALHVLGHQAPVLHRLRLPDSHVADHLDELRYRVERSVRGADLVICPAAEDGHPDHAAVGRVALEVCADQVPVWQMPIWIWHWTRPDRSSLDWRRVARLDLADGARRLKRRALASFRTQLGPVPGDACEETILPAEVLAHFTRPYEAFLV